LARPSRPHRGGFVSRPASAASPHRLVGQEACPLGLWRGRLSSVAGRSSLPRHEAVTKYRVAPSGL
jgi:hypothetical protein